MIIGFSNEGCQEDYIKQVNYVKRPGTVSFLNNSLQKMRARAGKGERRREHRGAACGFCSKVRLLT